MLLRNDHQHPGMDLRDQFVRLSCDNRAGAHPLFSQPPTTWQEFKTAAQALTNPKSCDY
jgi:hypothetical protein